MKKSSSVRLLAALECASLDLRELEESVQEVHRLMGRLNGSMTQLDAFFECAALDQCEAFDLADSNRGNVTHG